MQTWGKGQEIPNDFLVCVFYCAQCGLLQKNQVIYIYKIVGGTTINTPKPASLPVTPPSLPPAHCFLNHSRIFWFSQIYHPYTPLQGSLHSWCPLPQITSPQLLPWPSITKVSAQRSFPEGLLKPHLYPTPHSTIVPYVIGPTVPKNSFFSSVPSPQLSVSFSSMSVSTSHPAPNPRIHSPS